MEYWDVYDINGNKLGYAKRADEEFFMGEYRLGASLWIADSSGKLLIQKRAPSKKTGPNLWSITGGKVQSGESSTEACLREVREEIGLALSENSIQFLYRSIGSGMLFDDYIAIIDFPASQATLSSSEVSAIKWTTLDDIQYLYAEGEFLYNNISDLSKVNDYLNKRLIHIKGNDRL